MIKSQEKIDLFLFFIISLSLGYKYSAQIFFDNRLISYAVLIVTFCVEAISIVYHAKDANGILSISLLRLCSCAIVCILFFIPRSQPDLVLSFLLLLSVVAIGIPAFIEYYAFIASIFFALQLLLFKIGIIVDHTDLSRTETGTVAKFRSSLGFDHPNYVICFIFPILCGAIYSKKLKNKLSFLIMSTFFCIASYIETDSRTCLSVLLVAIVLCFISMSENISARLSKYSYLLPFFFLGISFLVTLLNSNLRMNQFLSWRPYSWYSALADGVKPFGPSAGNQKLYDNGGSIDNFYLHTLLMHGYVVCIIILFCLSVLAKQSCENRDYGICLIIILYLIYGLMEHHGLDYGYSILSPLILVPVLYQSNRGKKFS